MTSGNETLEILEGFANTHSWLPYVSAASDNNRNELGFFARSVYDQFARRDCLIIALARTSDSATYAGHLLYDTHYPRAHVRQMFVTKEHRRGGIATALLNRLKESLNSTGFISLYARVAEDLAAANAFWERSGFYIQRAERGGATKQRTILVRCHELATPQLIPPSGLTAENPLGLTTDLSSEIPMYLLDMNVLFDVQPRRFRRQQVHGLFQAERMNFCRLAISSEVHDELQRSTLSSRTTDPMEAYVDLFPTIPLDRSKADDPIFSELRSLVFPLTPNSKLTPNQKSDLHHLITAIKNNMTGLITNDSAMIDAAEQIHANYKVRVLPTAAFEAEEPPVGGQSFESFDKEPLEVRTVTSTDEGVVRKILREDVGLTGPMIAARWLPIGTAARIAQRLAVWCGPTCVGYVTWPAVTTDSSPINAHVAIVESHPQAHESARIALLILLESARARGPVQIVLNVPPRQSLLREVAAGIGFVEAGGNSSLIKYALGMVVGAANWDHVVDAMERVGGPKLPSTAPKFHNPDQQVAMQTASGNRSYISLDRLESLLQPSLFCLRGRKAVITPVQRKFAEPLLGHSPQLRLLPHTTVSLFADRRYFSKPGNLKHFERGNLVLFYESGKSGGGAQIVAVARVRTAYLKRCDDLQLSDLRQSALTHETIGSIGVSKMKCVVEFDNIFALPAPVSLATLKELGCGRPNDLISTKPISDEQCSRILSEGFRGAI